MTARPCERNVVDAGDAARPRTAESRALPEAGALTLAIYRELTGTPAERPAAAPAF
jgi:hypothetical protein